MLRGQVFQILDNSGGLANRRREKNMRFPSDDFMSFMGYRHMVVEEKIEECLSAARRGETSITIDRDDLTDDEVAYLQEEVQRRLGGW